MDKPKQLEVTGDKSGINHHKLIGAANKHQHKNCRGQIVHKPQIKKLTRIPQRKYAVNT